LGTYLIRRILLAIPVLIGVTTLTFVTMISSAGNYIPGVDLESTLRPEDMARLRESLGLDRPAWVQYLSWLRDIATGNLGRSMIDHIPITTHLAERLPNTLLLSAAAIVLGNSFGVLIGIACALNRGKMLDKVLSSLAVAGFAIPQFWFGLLLILVFAVGFQSWGLPSLPSSGAYDPVGGGGLGDRLLHLILPATTLSLVYISSWSRFVRSSMLGVLSEGYVRTARSKGLAERRVVFVHALRNALMPLVTLIGLEIPRLFSGALVVEVIFGWPGVGRFAYERASSYDYTAVLGVTTFVAIMVTFGNILADVLYGALDPRIRLQ
jgi:peptide/nickel transport system permease protein